jgi:hypothetical protein
MIGRRRFLGLLAALPLLAGCGGRSAGPLPATAAGAATATPATASPAAGLLLVTASIDADRPTRPISPLIYGLAEHDERLRPGLVRWGGNPSSRYNWELGNAWSAAADWEFRNGNYGATTDADRAPSGAADQAIAAAQRAGVPFLLTVPALGWVARDDNSDTRSLDVPWQGGPASGPAGDGGQGDQGAIAGYDPSANRARTSLRSIARKGAPFAFPPDRSDGVVAQDEWVAHLVDRFGPASAGGVRFYAVDNEPDLWSVTHRDIHPAQTTYDSVLATFLEYATAIKAVDPSAEVVGPVLSGWTGLFFSAADRGEDNFATAADRRAHDGLPFAAWFLQSVRAHDAAAGRRTLDALAVHWYPQNEEYAPGKTDPVTNARRLRATRQLWDASYWEESWIGRTSDIRPEGAVRLIPRLRAWIDQYYPGTKLGLTEWNYGADDTLNGALAIADVLGIFGREGVDLAAYWRAPAPDSPGALAFRLYRDYDGQGGRFGDQALAVQRADGHATTVSLYASRDDATGDAVVILVNKDTERAADVTLQFNGGGWADRAALHRYGATNLAAIERDADLPVGGGGAHVTVPASSLALVRLPARPAATPGSTTEATTDGR